MTMSLYDLKSSPFAILRAAALALAIAACGRARTSPTTGVERATDLGRINHVVVIYLENRSFDNLYGDFPGAEGRASPAAARYPQVDSSGRPYQVLPQAPGSPYPPNLPNAPFDIERYVPATMPSPNLTHLFYHEQMQINGGRR